MGKGNIRLEDILDKVAAYNASADLDVIKRAYVFSAKVHEGQTRLSGEPYLSHPIEVAAMLADLRMDASTVAVGLLHDTVEDSRTTVEKIKELFGAEIASLVDGLTKLSRITFEKKEDREAENFRKFILAMAKDIRVVIVKLVDRLHNMQTLDAHAPERRVKIARETLDIYAPLANRLGMGSIKAELEDLCLMHLEPEKYGWLKERVSKEREEKKKYIEDVKVIIEEKLKEYGLSGEVSGRVKHLHSIYRKMSEQDVDFENIYDILAFRVIVESVKDCYAVLGIMHSTWKPVPGRFKDFIAIPKPNLYQSLHTTVVGPFGERMEIQIRTQEMHRVAEYGIAAHWKYKEGMDVAANKDDKSFAWIRQLLEWQKDLTDSYEFLETLKVDLFPEDVFVFTPKGAIKVFPTGATPVDFAYAVHSDIGDACTGAKVNGKIVPLKHVLRNGNVVEIITSSSHAPSKDWLKFVVTSKARAKVKQWIKNEERGECMKLGKEICEKELKKYDVDFSKLVKFGEMERIAKHEFGLAGADQLILNIGYGKISVHQFVLKAVPQEKLAQKKQPSASTFQKMLDKFKGKRKPASNGGVVIKGIEDIMIKFAKCCEPLPGEPIAGSITHGQGVTIHVKGCSKLADIDTERRIDVEWDKATAIARPIRIEVVAKDEKGLLADMGNAIKNADANISYADIRTTLDNKAVCTFEVNVKSIEHLKSVMKALQKIKKVVKVERIWASTGHHGEHRVIH